MKKYILLSLLGTVNTLVVMGLICFNLTALGINIFSSFNIFNGVEIILENIFYVTMSPLTKIFDLFGPILGSGMHNLIILDILGLLYIGVVTMIFWKIGCKLLKIEQ
jgi:hypothetical protein